MAKKKEYKSQCCNAAIYTDSEGAHCGSCDGNPHRSDDYNEGCGDESCDGTCNWCNKHEPLEEQYMQQESFKYYDIEALSDFTKELITITDMASLHMNAIAPDKQWYPTQFGNIVVKKDIIILITYFTNGVDFMQPLIHLSGLGDCTFIAINYNQNQKDEYKNVKGALSDSVLREMLTALNRNKPKITL